MTDKTDKTDKTDDKSEKNVRYTVTRKAAQQPEKQQEPEKQETAQEQQDVKPEQLPALPPAFVPVYTTIGGGRGLYCDNGPNA